ncbi:unnamed protein product [Didymodactylos carnosus]|uniref:6-phosphogluconolactonase n=1 Tax=Didymodactylos carnosus TaxID=1234261 RepID=A0A814NLX0_9BILA|nr:unnamed protein product [Didymodactylos carnosus]CAF1410852.1 unnamed protein product [Didymodactylos carnosus]CAF3859448.1 unnamed protein product [Didymodactylos carnosus]CAF4214934.1 unnamed protein product [Didymodactylos carnosus]
MSQLFLVGTGEKVVYSCHLSSTGQLQKLDEQTTGDGPSWLQLSLTKNIIYIVNEFVHKIATYSIEDRLHGKISLLSTPVSSLGETPCHLDVHPSGKYLGVANYGGKSTFAIFPLLENGIPDVEHAITQDIEGSGPKPQQVHSRGHCILFHGSYVYVVDLGTDSINSYHFDDSTGQIKPNHRTLTEAGAGPRHLVFHPTKPLAYVCNELNSTTNAYSVDKSLGKLTHIQTITTRKNPNDKTDNAPAEITFSPDYKYLLVSNRGDNTIIVYNCDLPDGQLTIHEHLDCKGAFARYFGFDPTGQFLLIANQNSNNLICYSYKNEKFNFCSELSGIKTGQHIFWLNNEEKK